MKAAFLVMGATLSIFILGFVLRSAGLFGDTVVERKIFEQSYQRQESIKSELAINEATLAEIEIKLQNSNLDTNTRINLEAQKSAIRIRIEAVLRRIK